MTITHLTREQLEAGLDAIRQAPSDNGVLEMIVRRHRIGERELLEAGELDLVQGLVGDSWMTRVNPRTPDGKPHPDTQVNIMGARAIALIAPDKARRPLSGDQLFLDMDLSPENLPPGTRFEIGDAVLEVTAEPHTGCAKFVERYGVEAMKFVNSPAGRALNLRGINTRVVRSGAIRIGDRVRKQTTGL